MLDLEHLNIAAIFGHPTAKLNLLMRKPLNVAIRESICCKRDINHCLRIHVAENVILYLNRQVLKAASQPLTYVGEMPEERRPRRKTRDH